MIGVWARNLLITVGAVLLVCAGLYLCFVTPHHRSAPPESAVGLLNRADTLAWGNRWADAATFVPEGRDGVPEGASAR